MFPTLNTASKRRVFLALAAVTIALTYSANAQVITTYTDEGTFNAVTANLQSITEPYEGLAPAGGSVQNPDLPSGYKIGPVCEVGDGAYGQGYLSLNGSAFCYADGGGYGGAELDIYAPPDKPMTAFGTNVGTKDRYGSPIAYGGNDQPGPTLIPYPYPLTDTVEISLYSDDGQVGETFQAGVIANGFVGVVSTVPFRYVHINLVQQGTLYDRTGYQLQDPYWLVVDNSRFAQSPTLPTVTVTGSSPNANATTGQAGDFVVTLSAPAATDLKVLYSVKGTAQPGVDYVALSGKVKIKAGQTSKKIKVQPTGDLGGAGKKVLKLTLQPGTGYLIGTPDPVKLKIFSFGEVF